MVVSASAADVLLEMVGDSTLVTAGTIEAAVARVTAASVGNEPAPLVDRLAAVESNELEGTMVGITPITYAIYSH